MKYWKAALAPEAIVMSWRGMKGGIEAAKQGHSVIMTPTDHCYLDFYQGRSDSRTKHLFHAAPTGLLQISTHSR
ncbi:family 20 glycosylhydrolase [Bacteroides salyersiae]|nr:family 20 glycosylhydrolase [Bacteroides salyersiae]